MKASEYARKVKRIKKSALLTSVEIAITASSNLMDSIIRLEEEKLDLNGLAESWNVSKSVKTEVSKNFRLPSGFGYSNILTQCINANQLILDEVKHYLEKDKDSIWDSATLTFKQVAILDTIDKIDTWNDYTMLSLDVLVSKLNNGNKQFGSHLTKADLSYLDGTLPYYRTLTLELYRGAKFYIDELNAVADIEASDENEAVIEEGVSKITATLRNSGIGVHRLNPKFWYDLQRSKYNLTKIENLRKENETLAMTINLAIEKLNGDENPMLEAQIEVSTALIQKNKAVIDQIVGSYA